MLKKLMIVLASATFILYLELVLPLMVLILFSCLFGLTIDLKNYLIVVTSLVIIRQFLELEDDE